MRALHIRNVPEKLIARARAQAALKGETLRELVIRVLEQETKELDTES